MARLAGALFVVLALSPLSAQDGPWMRPMTSNPPGSLSGAPRRGNSAMPMPEAEIDRVQAWLDAIAAHQPGETDPPATKIGSWSMRDLRMLWINATTLLSLMHDLTSTHIVIAANGFTNSKTTYTVKPDGMPEQDIYYAPEQLGRLKFLACAAVGLLPCGEASSTGPGDPSLDRLSTLVAAARKRGDGNAMLRRGAMLHADVVMTGAVHPDAATEDEDVPAPEQMRIHLNDGRETDRAAAAIHWVLARLLLDTVTPPGKKKRAPGRDAMVRQWYGATAAWMQQQAELDITHLERARQLFPDDADILFFNGCAEETFASPFVQDTLASLVAPLRFHFRIATAVEEMRRAEGFFRRALDARPTMGEARLHLGHVLLEQRRYKDAESQLRDRPDWPSHGESQYYRSLFLGAAEQALHKDDAARASYRWAAALQPAAQSPLIALAALDWRRADRTAALGDVDRLFALASDDGARSDPWWSYYSSPGRDAEARISALWRQVQQDSP